jgi:anti-sigma factor ChrR (cupin superfamily)
MSEPAKSWIADSGALPWRPTLYAGVRWKKLRFDRKSGRSAVLLEFAPGASYGAHRHPQGEEYFVLSGSLQDGGRVYGPGHYVWHAPDSVHRPSSAEGCSLLVWLDAPIEPV